MVYDPTKDFIGLWRLNAGQVSKAEMPGLDYVVAALARAGLITLSVGAIAPVVNQSTTAWLQAAVPSYSAEGVMRLWDAVAATYVAATPALLFKMLQTAAQQNGVSWYTTAVSPPSNVIGLDGDFAIVTIEPGGIYGPKLAGAWPAQPLPGTTDIIGSTQLDQSFGAVPGNMIYRDGTGWHGLPLGVPNTVLASVGGVPAWDAITTLLDVLFSNARGSILFRGAGGWAALIAGLAGQVLATGGAGADPSWQPRTAEFPSGTVMLFQQTAAPTGWVKSFALNDVGLRVTSGAVGSVAGSAFSTVFAQTAVGNTTLAAGTIPAHTHTIPGFINVGALNLNFAGAGAQGGIESGGQLTGSIGGGGAHSHSVNLTLAYVDVIIATKA